MRKLARAIAARNEPHFITVPPHRGGSKVHYTEEQFTVMRGRLTAEEYRWKSIRMGQARLKRQAHQGAVSQFASFMFSFGY
jgi:hypothetical protein